MELREYDSATGVSIRDILPECQIFGAENVRVQSCCHDWNDVQPGDLYVAKVGFEKDGHDHIRIAAKKGAAAILSERFVVSDVPVCLVEDTREAYGKICQRLVGNPKDNLKIIGVTGTDGKSVVSYLMQKVFHHCGIRTGMVSSLGFCDGVVNEFRHGETPQSPQLADHLRELVENNCEAAVLEVSSLGIAERRVSGIELDACVYTNIRKDHLDVHGTVENYRRIKTKLVNRLKPSGFAVLNSDDKFLNKWATKIGCPTLTYGTSNYAEVTAQVLEQTPWEQTFLLVAGDETVPVRTSMVGDYYVRHCLAVTTTALTFGLKLEDIAAGLESVRSIPGRMERVDCPQGVSVFVDSAKTPDQLCGMLKSLSRMNSSGRIHCVFGGTDRIAPDQRAGLGTVAERYSDQAIIANVDSQKEAALEVAHDVLDGFDDVSQAHVIPNRAAAIRFVLDSARPGDLVLIAGQGEKTTQFGLNGEHHLSDKDLCEMWIKDPTSLDELYVDYDQHLPISYPIDNYR